MTAINMCDGELPRVKKENGLVCKGKARVKMKEAEHKNTIAGSG